MLLLPNKVYNLAFANSPCLVTSSYISSICFLNALAACGRLVLRLLSLLGTGPIKCGQVVISFSGRCERGFWGGEGRLRWCQELIVNGKRLNVHITVPYFLITVEFVLPSDLI